MTTLSAVYKTLAVFAAAAAARRDDDDDDDTGDCRRRTHDMTQCIISHLHHFNNLINDPLQLSIA